VTDRSPGASDNSPAGEALVEWLFSLSGPELKWDLATAAAFSAWLGHPERRFRTVHIAGTNGKGSVAAQLHAIALAAGVPCGLYTSPHLVRPEERIRIGDRDIDGVRFRALIERLRESCAAALAAGAVPRHPTFFEIMTAAAFTAFAEDGIGLAVVETGLGGRLDATNVITPELSIITTIGLDHVKTLGGDLVSIALEKAGIVKPGVPVLAGWIAPEPLAAIERRARDLGADLHAAERELRVLPRDDGTFDLVTPDARYVALAPALGGPHQLANAALAVRAAELMRTRGLPATPDAVARGLRATRWPGRLERIGACLLDGAHNEDGALALARALSAHGNGARPPRLLVFGMTEGRDAASLVAPLRPHVDRVIVTRPGIAKSVEPEQVRAALARAFPDLAVEVECDPARALERAVQEIPGQGEVLVAGSLYLVGDARRILLGLAGSGHPARETRVADAAPDPVPAPSPGPASGVRS
jgi:dihydrofolate synthase / folylpolyglutamate synthase